MPFKKKVISIDNEGLSRAEAIAEEKITLLQSAMKEAEKHIHIDDFKAFSKDFIAYTTKKIIDKNKGLKDLRAHLFKKVCVKYNNTLPNEKVSQKVCIPYHPRNRS